MNENIENYFLRMGHLLQKINKHRLIVDSRQNKDKGGRIEISSTRRRRDDETFSKEDVISHMFNLAETQKGDFLSTR